MSGFLSLLGSGRQSTGSIGVQKGKLDPFVFTDKPTPGAIGTADMIDQPNGSTARWMFDETARQNGLDPRTVVKGSPEHQLITRDIGAALHALKQTPMPKGEVALTQMLRGAINQAVAASAELARSVGGAAKDLACSLPTVNGGGGVDAYAGLGVSLSGGVAINPRNGQLSIQFGGGVGVGAGAAAYGKIGGGGSGGIAKGESKELPIATAGIVVNVAAQAGVGVGGSYQIAGSNPGDWSASGARAGPGITGNVNGGATAALNLPALYDLGCK